MIQGITTELESFPFKASLRIQICLEATQSLTVIKISLVGGSPQQ